MKKTQLKQHISSRTEKIKYIVIHDTGNTNRGAGAKAHERYFMTTQRKASADFIVENNEIIQLNNYEKYYTWHCGDGKGKYGITNSNSIGIEMCVNNDSNKQATINTTIMLTYKLMKELNIDITKVVRHYDASKKNCPSSLSYDNWRGWTKFKNSLHDYIEEQEEDDIIIIKYKNQTYCCEGYNKNNYNYVKIRDLAKILNLEISGKGMVVSLKNK